MERFYCSLKKFADASSWKQDVCSVAAAARVTCYQLWFYPWSAAVWPCPPAAGRCDCASLCIINSPHHPTFRETWVYRAGGRRTRRDAPCEQHALFVLRDWWYNTDKSTSGYSVLAIEPINAKDGEEQWWAWNHQSGIVTNSVCGKKRRRSMLLETICDWVLITQVYTYLDQGGAFLFVSSLAHCLVLLVEASLSSHDLQNHALNY